MHLPRIPLTASALAVAALVAGPLAPAVAADAVVPDEILRECINTTLKHEPGTEVTKEDVAALTGLSCSYDAETSKGKVKSLEGLQYAAKLTSVGLNGNDIESFDELAEDTNLQSISMDGNPLKALPEGIGKLENLWFLAVHRDYNRSADKITTLEPLRPLKKLNFLNIEFSGVTDLSPLENSFTTMGTLMASSSPIKDFTDVGKMSNLQKAWLSGPAGLQKARDLTPLNNLHKVQQLYLNDNQLTAKDLTALKPDELTSLTSLRFHNNHIDDVSVLDEFAKRDSLAIMAHNQTLTLPDAVVGDVDNPKPLDYGKAVIAVKSADDRVKVTGGNTVTYTAPSPQGAPFVLAFDNERPKWSAARNLSGTYTVTVKSAADAYDPQYTATELYQGDTKTVPAPKDKNGKDFPEGTTFARAAASEDAPGSDPAAGKSVAGARAAGADAQAKPASEDWAKVAGDGTIALSPSTDVAAGDYTVPVRVTYPDKTTDDIEAPVKVLATAPTTDPTATGDPTTDPTATDDPTSDPTGDPSATTDAPEPSPSDSDEPNQPSDPNQPDDPSQPGDSDRPNGHLPRTGGTALLAGGVGLALVVAGAAALMGARRRRS